jgi:uncharacterized membrane protein
MPLRRQRPPRAEHAFAAVALLFGIAVAFVTPPFDSPDEPRHLQRAWLLSQGRIALPGAAPSSGGAVPESLMRLHPPYTRGTNACRHRPAELWATLATPLEPERTSDEIRTPILYGPIGYLPQALALAPARWLGAGAGSLLYVARLANLAAFVGLCALAVACAPARRLVLASAALLPMSLFEASTVSADAMTNALALLLLALVLRTASRGRDRVRAWELAGIIGLICLLGLGKPGYSLLALLVVAIPAECFGDVTRRRWVVAVAMAAGLIVPAAWWAAVQHTGPFPYPGADPAAQLAGLLRAPWQLAGAVAATLGERALDFARATIGVLGRLDVVLPPAAYLGWSGLLLAVSGVDGARSPRLDARSRVSIAVVGAAGAVAISALLYISATPPGASRVVGIQGRYFLAFVPLALVGLPVLREVGEAARWWIPACWVLGHGLTLHALWTRYYVP